MIFKYCLISIIILTVGWTTSITGYINDSVTGQSISNANIYIRELDEGTTSNVDGYFSLNIVIEKNYLLEISHIGYKNQFVSVDISHNKDLIVLLNETFYQMNDVVVTGTRTPKILQNVPIATEVINEEEINNSGIQNVGELLDLRSGVSVASSIAGENIVSIMGMDSKYILILIDGQPIVGKFNSRTSLDEISIQNVKKIEIIKGPSSSLYGSEAMGGVINIITDHIESDNIDFAIKYDGSDNSFNPFDLNMGTRILDAQYTNLIKKITYKISSQLKHVNVNNKNKYSNLDAISQASINSNIQWEINNSQTLKTSASTFINNEESNLLSQTNNISIKRNSFNITHMQKFSSMWIFEQFFRYGNYSRNKKNSDIDGTLVSNDLTKENESELELCAIYNNGNTTMNVGSELIYYNYIGDRINDNKKSLESISLYSQLDITPFENWNFIIGVRSDNNSQLKPVYNPRIAAMYSYKKRWKFRGMWGQGFRMPTSQELFFEWFHNLGGGTGYKVIGNPDLRPETSNGNTIGFEYYHPSIYRVSLMFYSTNFFNMITDYNLPNSACGDINSEWNYGCLSYRNINRVKYTGVELQGSFNLSNDWKTEWGFNWIDNVDLSTNESLPNTQIFSSRLSLTHKLNKIPFRYIFHIKWIGPYYPMEYVPSENIYQTSNTKRKSQYFVNYTSIWDAQPSFSIETGIKNIINQVDTTYGPFIGRTYYIKFNYIIK